jgi:hypothetical protein
MGRAVRYSIAWLMTENQKTVAAAAMLAAAVGVYMEISYQEKLHAEARRRAYHPEQSASAAASAARPPDAGARPPGR